VIRAVVERLNGGKGRHEVLASLATATAASAYSAQILLSGPSDLIFEALIKLVGKLTAMVG
jgi:hypothetical protein